MNDPFANDPFAPVEDEAQQAPTATTDHWTEETPVTNTPANINVTANAEGKLVVTLKGGKDFSDPWLVFHCADIEDALEQLRHDKIKELITLTKSAGQFFAGQGGGQSQQQARGGGQQAPRTQGRPQGATEAPGGQTKECAHGEMVFKTGVSKSSGKPWKAFMCPSSDRSNQCDPVWIR